MINTKRLHAAAHYLSFASPPWGWSWSRAQCPLCGTALFVSLKASAHMTRCTSCWATVTNLSLIPVIQRHFSGVRGGGGLRSLGDLSAYELSTYGSTLKFLHSAFGTVTASEFFPDQKLGIEVGETLNQDVQSLTFDDASFDLVTSNQVLEHVPDDRLALSECRRVLRTAGALIFSVPMYDVPRTEQLARLENGELVWLGVPEYHDSRLAGPKSAPVFWRHSSRDIIERVAAVGFSCVELVDVMVASCQRDPAQVVYAVK